MGEGSRRANREAVAAEEIAPLLDPGPGTPNPDPNEPLSILFTIAGKPMEGAILADAFGKPDPTCAGCKGEGIEGAPCDLCWAD